MQAFLGRTGKEGLKRQVTTLEPSKVSISMANYVEKVYLSKSDLDSIRDVSAGAATFFVWVGVKLSLTFNIFQLLSVCLSRVHCLFVRCLQQATTSTF